MNASLIPYLKEIGRGKDGMRNLTFEQARQLWGWILDGQVGDLELGAFCIAMRIKSETPEEMAGFLDATHARLRVPASLHPDPARATTVVLPSYNGARKLPLLTPLLAVLLQRAGLQVLLHGMRTEARRITAPEVLAAMSAGLNASGDTLPAWVDTGALCSGLPRILRVRYSVGLRNSAHSLVKLMNPLAGTPAAARTIVVGSYTHPEYAESMAATIALMQGHALLLRGTEGEPVADPRRLPQLNGYLHGTLAAQRPAQGGSLASLPDLPQETTAEAAARYSLAVLRGELPVPQPLTEQVDLLRSMADELH